MDRTSWGYSLTEKKIIILGAKGMLGHELCKVFPHALKWDREELDITDKAEVQKRLTQERPDYVINAAAYTDVDGAETDKAAFLINRDAVGHVARACQTCSSILIHFSTDYVFDGKKKGYDENDPLSPINEYGRSKAEGEALIKEQLSRWYIIRTAWLYGENGKNFVKTILRLAKEKEFLTVVDDQHGNPTYAKDLAIAVKGIMGKPFGIYHLTNSGDCSWFGFANEIMRKAGLSTPVRPMKSGMLKRAAPRPVYSILNNNKAALLRPWELALGDYLNSMK